MKEERLSGALQENILTALCFDDGICKLIRAAVSPQLFESSVYREVAGHAIDFIDQFGEAIKEHLPDQLEDILKGEDQRKAENYRRLLENLYLAKDGVNSEYVLSQLQKFVRRQNLKNAVVRAVEALEGGEVDEAEIVLHKGLASQVVAFNPGLNLGDPEQLRRLLDEPEEEGFSIGIPELDERGIKLYRKEALGFIAARGKGKSWKCTHVAKWGLVQGCRVLIVTLEMSEKRYAVRLLQSFFSISKREAKVRLAKIVDSGRDYLQVVHEEVERISLRDPDIKQTLATKVKRHMRCRDNLRIKSFPTGTLTIEQLEAYLDGLERYEKFTPDIIIVDYPHLMKHNAANKRVELMQIGERLRGILVDRNAAGFFPTQGNRESEGAKVVTGGMAAEDISFLATVDGCLTYSQTMAEHRLGLARIFVEKMRNEEAKQTILITQAYAIGQFCLDSKLIDTDKYWDYIGGDSGHDYEDEEDEEDDRPRRRTRRLKANDGAGLEGAKRRLGRSR